MGSPKRHSPRKTALIQARYMDQSQLELFLLGVFGPGKCAVKVRDWIVAREPYTWPSGEVPGLTALLQWTRGYYQCTLPRGLKQAELEQLAQKIALENYEVL